MNGSLLLLCLVLASPAAPAQGPMPLAAGPKPAAEATAAPTASVDVVIDRYLQALGGKAALEKLTSRLTRGSIVPAEGENIPLEVYWKAPDRWLQVIGASDEGQTRAGFDGKAGWTQDSQGQVRAMTGEMLASIRHTGAFFQQARLRDLYAKMTLKGAGKIESRDVQLIEATRADGATETLAFDSGSGLLVRRDVVRQTPQGPQTTRFTYEEYRVVDGVRVPFLTRQRRDPSAPELTIKVSEVKHNVPVDDTKFRKPS